MVNLERSSCLVRGPAQRTTGLKRLWGHCEGALEPVKEIVPQSEVQFSRETMDGRTVQQGKESKSASD